MPKVKFARSLHSAHSDDDDDLLSGSSPTAVAMQRARRDVYLDDIPIARITAESPLQSRDAFDPMNNDDDEEFSETIRQFGNFVPILVMKRPEKDWSGAAPEYLIIYGFRRRDACAYVGRPTVFAMVLENIPDANDLVLAFLKTVFENDKRSNLTGYQTALSYVKTQKELTRVLGRKPSPTELASNLKRKYQSVYQIMNVMENAPGPLLELFQGRPVPPKNGSKKIFIKRFGIGIIERLLDVFRLVPSEQHQQLADVIFPIPAEKVGELTDSLRKANKEVLEKLKGTPIGEASVMPDLKMDPVTVFSQISVSEIDSDESDTNEYSNAGVGNDKGSVPVRPPHGADKSLDQKQRGSTSLLNIKDPAFFSQSTLLTNDQAEKILKDKGTVIEKYIAAAFVRSGGTRERGLKIASTFPKDAALTKIIEQQAAVNRSLIAYAHTHALSKDQLELLAKIYKCEFDLFEKNSSYAATIASPSVSSKQSAKGKAKKQ
jgi:ParB/RepB/Spo0J family partition protein